MKIQHKCNVTLWGGFGEATRCIAIFGEYLESDLPVRLIEIKPLSNKFAPILSHRDFLGAVTSLGIKREMIGDIIVFENSGYMFCIDSVFTYIIENLKTVGRAAVKCIALDTLPVEARPKMKEISVIVSSFRLDSVISSVYNLSRGTSKQLFIEKKVFLNSVECQNPAYTLKQEDKVSVRGFGKFIFDGEKMKTRKSNSVLQIRLYS